MLNKTTTHMKPFDTQRKSRVSWRSQVCLLRGGGVPQPRCCGRHRQPCLRQEKNSSAGDRDPRPRSNYPQQRFCRRRKAILRYLGRPRTRKDNTKNKKYSFSVFRRIFLTLFFDIPWFFIARARAWCVGCGVPRPPRMP